MTIRKRSKKLMAMLALSVAFSAAIALWHGEIKRQLFVSGIVDRVQFGINTLRLAPYIDEIILLASIPADASFHTKVDRVRLFIRQHTGYVLDEEIYGPDGGEVVVAKMVIAHAEGKTRELPGIDCSWRAELMANILVRMGYETRVVSAFDTDLSPDVPQRSHTFISVKNPETGRWETQDPEFDLYWKSSATGERVSVTDLAENFDQLLPCRSQSCGWNVFKDGTPRALTKLFDIFTIFNRTNNTRYSIYTSRADLNEIHENDGRHGRFCDVYFYSCRDGFLPARKDVRRELRS